jgi:hypothetical protein
MDPFARFSENHQQMSEHTRHLRLLEGLSPQAAPAEDSWSEPGSVAFLHQWRAARIARSKSMHPSNLARAAALPAPRLVP